MDFGWDRGTPIDRYYIEAFLRQHSRDITGRVLEIGDDFYSRLFGNGITELDVLHVSSENPKVTITGDITTRGVLPEGAFDCIIFTQTLQLIYDIDEAVQRLHAALKPGGILLLTVSGISQIDRHEWGTNWCWSFTVSSLHRLFERVFGRGDLQLSAHGNVFAAICFLTGAVVEDVDTKDLDVRDPAYPVNITLRAQRAK
jgi:SAM-dependent methyltransferase